MKPLDITEIAQELEIRKKNDTPTVLFLGSRAGGLFRSQFFYKTLQAFSTRNFSMLSQTEQFAECYRILTSGHFGESDIHAILRVSQQSLAPTKTDIIVANLVTQGFFEIIITTNIDDTLEQALAIVGAREDQDYVVFIPDNRHGWDKYPHQPHIIKIFGDFSSRQYDIERSNFLDNREKLRANIEGTLAKNVLMIGLDPLWDGNLIPAFPKQGGDLWYINEVELSPNDFLFQALRDRLVTYLVGKSGSYENFWQLLPWQLYREMPIIDGQDIATQLQTARKEIEMIWQQKVNQLELNPLTEDSLAVEEQELPPFLDQPEETYVLTPTPTELENEKKKKVFICYSHKDIKYLLRLQTHFASYGRKYVVDIWDDTKINAGSQWREEIAGALKTTKVAVLLISADFLASEFITENELPPLLKAAESGGTIILPVILSPCLFEETPLQQFQAVNHPSKPLSKLTGSGRDEIWVVLVRLIMKIINSRDFLKIDEQNENRE